MILVVKQIVSAGFISFSIGPEVGLCAYTNEWSSFTKGRNACNEYGDNTHYLYTHQIMWPTSNM